MFQLTLPAWLSIAFVVVEYVIKIVAIGVVPENRRPSSSQLIGSPYVQGRRHRIQADANAMILGHTGWDIYHYRKMGGRTAATRRGSATRR